MRLRNHSSTRVLGHRTARGMFSRYFLLVMSGAPCECLEPDIAEKKTLRHDKCRPILSRDLRRPVRLFELVLCSAEPCAHRTQGQRGWKLPEEFRRQRGC